MIIRHDNGLWAVPGGCAEIGETLAQAAERELFEETGIHSHVTRLLGIFDLNLWHSQTKIQVHHVMFQAVTENVHPSLGIEAIDVDFFDRDHLPSLSPGHHLRVPFMSKILNGELPIPYFDPSRNDG